MFKKYDYFYVSLLVLLKRYKSIMIKKLSYCISLVLIMCFTGQLTAQPAEQIVKIIVAPDHEDWVYRPGENVKFSVTVLQYGNPVPNVKIRYEIGPEKMIPVISVICNPLTVRGSRFFHTVDK